MLRSRAFLVVGLVVGCATQSESILEGKQCGTSGECIDGYACNSVGICVRQSELTAGDDDSDDAPVGDDVQGDDAPDDIAPDDDVFDDDDVDNLGGAGGAGGTDVVETDAGVPVGGASGGEGGAGGSGGEGGQGDMETDAGVDAGPPDGPSTEIRTGVCGDGVVDEGEDCDDAGLSEECTLDCQSRQTMNNCSLGIAFGTHYVFCDYDQDWVDAEEVCEQAGGYLQEVNDLREDGVVQWLAEERGVQDYWIGANDRQDEGTWVWTGSQVAFWQGGANGGPVEERFSAWNRIEPSSSSSDCAAHVDGTATWFGFSCSALREFVCELSPRPGPPATCGDGVLDDDEVCDPLAHPAACDPDCTVARCGDGYVNAEAGERCDDGNQVDDDLCSNICVSVPDPPQNIRVTTGGFRSATLSWTPADDGGKPITSYNVHRLGTDQSTTQTQLMLLGLAPGWNAFSVSAVNAQGEGPASEVVTIYVQ